MTAFTIILVLDSCLLCSICLCESDVEVSQVSQSVSQSVSKPLVRYERYKFILITFSTFYEFTDGLKLYPVAFEHLAFSPSFFKQTFTFLRIPNIPHLVKNL